MLAVLRRRDFALLWLGQLISLTGDWVLFITLPFYVYQLTGSALATGAMFVVQILPRALFGSLAGVFVDRWSRKWTMIASDLSRAGLLLFLLFFHSRDQVWLVYVVATLETTISLFFTPARSAIVPHLVEQDQLVAANSLDSVADNMTRILGPSVGAALFGLLGAFASVAIIDSASYLFSALLIMLIRVPASAAEARETDTKASEANVSPKERWLAVWREWLEGLRIVKSEPVIRGIFIVLGLLVLGDSPLTAVIVPFVKNVLHGDTATLGWLMTARGAGGLLGSFITGWLSKYIRPSRLIMLGLLIPGVVILIIANIPSIPLALVSITLIGIIVMFCIISSETLMQQSVSDAYRGRIFGSYGTTSSLLAVIALAVASPLGDQVGSIPVLNASGALYILAGLSALIMLGGAVIQQPARPPATVEPGEMAGS
ncbi:MAG: MFS transporter [Ktedonobacteraceae bacterium]|nr:MFS transporter [Ktedonobacteraceae bacterium]